MAETPSAATSYPKVEAKWEDGEKIVLVWLGGGSVREFTQAEALKFGGDLIHAAMVPEGGYVE